jgi:hypothetical protein
VNGRSCPAACTSAASDVGVAFAADRRVASRATSAALSWATPLALTLGCSAYLWTRLDRGWYPHDEGTLAEPATRILNGELPHRDFVDAYTGGLSYLHAAAFLLFGRDLTSLRLVLFAFFVAWVPALYYVISRFVPPLAAAAVTLLAVAWSVPNYTASMPSWYCLFLATFGLAALLRHLETDRRPWLVVAGVCAGLSMCVKIVGVYFVAAAIVHFVFKTLSDPGRGPDRFDARGGLAAALSALGLVAATLFLLRARFGPREFVMFEVPIVLVALFLCWSAQDARRGDLGRLWRLVAPFFAGLVVPCAILAAPYVAASAVADLGRGIWPTSRLNFAALSPPSLWTLIALIPLSLIVVLARAHRQLGRAEARVGAAALAVIAALLLYTSNQGLAYELTWQSLRTLVPVVTAVGLIAVGRRRRRPGADPTAEQRVVLLIAVAAFCSLVQFPYSAPVYFIYVAPLVIAAAVAVAVYTNVPRPALLIIVLFYCAFGLARLNTGTLQLLGVEYRPAQLVSLGIGSADLDVPPADRQTYLRVVQLVRRHARGAFVYATPDAPEIYFLSGRQNPTRTLFEFLNPRPTTTPALLRTLAAHGVSVVVVNRRPAFSRRVSPGLQRALEARYPDSAAAGKFVVRWRP